MKIIWELLLKLSSTAAEKLYKSEVVQVDIHLDNGKKLMIMSRQESDKLIRCAHLLQELTPEKIAALQEQIDKFNKETAHG